LFDTPEKTSLSSLGTERIVKREFFHARFTLAELDNQCLSGLAEETSAGGKSSVLIV
jgi:hypothetical protein